MAAPRTRNGRARPRAARELWAGSRARALLLLAGLALTPRALVLATTPARPLRVLRQAAQDQAVAQREREVKAAQAIDKHREAEAHKVEAAKAAERRADDEREAARAAARAERDKIAAAAAAEASGTGGYSFDDFNQYS
jgi:type II secretory pathway component HofQ